MTISFGNPSPNTSELQIVHTAEGIDLAKLYDCYLVYTEVIRDCIGVEEAIARLDEIINRKAFMQSMGTGPDLRSRQRHGRSFRFQGGSHGHPSLVLAWVYTRLLAAHSGTDIRGLLQSSRDIGCDQ